MSHTRLRVCAVFVVLLVTRSAAAEGPVFKPIPPGDDKIEPVVQGQPAPFTGQLFDNKTALRWANWLEQAKARLVLDVEAEKKKADIRVETLEKQSLLDKQRYEEMTAVYQARLRELEKPPPFYKNVWFGVSLGVAATVMAVTATAYTIHATRQ